MRYFARILLLSLWLFAIVVPSVITLLSDEHTVMVTNLNEEEQQEYGKKVLSEEKIGRDYYFDFSVIAQSKKSVLGEYHTQKHIDYTTEILLPPPEYIS